MKRVWVAGDVDDVLKLGQQLIRVLVAACKTLYPIRMDTRSENAFGTVGT